jgi:hypothetical protein
MKGESMFNFCITPFAKSNKYSLELEDFEPKGGYEPFLKDVCSYLGATFLDWYQGVESGIGHIIYKEYKMTVYWTDFPFALSFDCANEAMAKELQEELKKYFETQEN